jgi:hypothetical protein
MRLTPRTRRAYAARWAEANPDRLTTPSWVSYGAHASWTAIPANDGRIPAASMPSVPRLGWTVTST